MSPPGDNAFLSPRIYWGLSSHISSLFILTLTNSLIRVCIRTPKKFVYVGEKWSEKKKDVTFREASVEKKQKLTSEEAATCLATVGIF